MYIHTYMCIYIYIQYIYTYIYPSLNHTRKHTYQTPTHLDHPHKYTYTNNTLFASTKINDFNINIIDTFIFP